MFSHRERAQRSAEIGTRHVTEFAIYAGLGALVGLAVAIIEWISIELLLHALLDAPLLVQVVVPGLGLLVTGLVLGATKTSTATSDQYVDAFHNEQDLPVSKLGPKLWASITTLGSGSALGLEGPAVYLGATLGSATSQRVPHTPGLGRRALIAAGAAAGVAAVFKAPATGVLFALEVPYRRDLARHALIPALIASAASYLTFVLLLGDERLLRTGRAEVAFRHEVFGAILVGILGGIVARMTVAVFKRAKHLPETMSAARRLPVVAVVLGACAVAANSLVELPATLGPGAEMVSEIVLDPGISAWAILALFGIRIFATSASLAGGGVGGLFIPLVVQGLLLGRLVELVLDAPTTGLYPVIGLAAMLGAGYRTPLAAVMFVAETTGRAEFVIPALLATAVSQALMGESSISTVQLDERKGHLERRLGRPVSAVTRTDVQTLHPGDRLVDVIDALGGDLLTPGLPVVTRDGCQVLVLHDVASVLFETGLDATVGDAMRSLPPVDADAYAMEAARLMNLHDCAVLAVVDKEGTPIGIVSAESLTGLSDLAADD